MTLSAQLCGQPVCTVNFSRNRKTQEQYLANKRDAVNTKQALCNVAVGVTTQVQHLGSKLWKWVKYNSALCNTKTTHTFLPVVRNQSSSLLDKYPPSRTSHHLSSSSPIWRGKNHFTVRANMKANFQMSGKSGEEQTMRSLPRSFNCISVSSHSGVLTLAAENPSAYLSLDCLN